MSKGYERIGNYVIELNKQYFLSYTGGSRELTKEKQRDWDKTNNLPFQLQIKERNRLGLENNPNLVPIKGSDLLSFIKELGFVPFFSQQFKDSPILQLTDVIIFESLKQKSYEIAMRG